VAERTRHGAERRGALALAVAVMTMSSPPIGGSGDGRVDNAFLRAMRFAWRVFSSGETDPCSKTLSLMAT